MIIIDQKQDVLSFFTEKFSETTMENATASHQSFKKMGLEKEPEKELLYALKSRINNDSQDTDHEISAVFQQEVVEKLCKADDNIKGYIDLTIRIISYEGNSALSLLSSMSLGILNVIGIPKNHATMSMECTVEIRNLHNGLIRRYKQKATDSAFIASWWGYDTENARLKTMHESAKEALKLIRKKISEDVRTINIELIKPA